MGEDRASLFAEDDLSEFQPAPVKRQNPAVAQQAAATSGFVSREPKVVPIASAGAPVAKREQRRYRTGRNMQLNLRCKAETIADFIAIADSQGWVLGEAFEQAVGLLQTEYPLKPGRGGDQ